MAESDLRNSMVSATFAAASPQRCNTTLTHLSKLIASFSKKSKDSRSEHSTMSKPCQAETQWHQSS